MDKLYLFHDKNSFNEEFVVLETQNLTIEEVEKEYGSKPVAFLSVVGDTKMWPTDRSLTEEH